MNANTQSTPGAAALEQVVKLVRLSGHPLLNHDELPAWTGVLLDAENAIAVLRTKLAELETLRASLEPFADAHEHAMGCPCADTDREADASECDCGMTGLRAAIAATK